MTVTVIVAERTAPDLDASDPVIADGCGDRFHSLSAEPVGSR